MTHKQELFVEYLLADPELNQTNAYQKAFVCTRPRATAGASELMTDPRIAALINERKAQRLKEAGLSQGEILAELVNVVTGDPRELMEFRRGACRHCWGAGFLYHRTPAEYSRDVEQYLAEQQAIARKDGRNVDGSDPDVTGVRFKVQGGIGYNRTKAANPECPECFGEGEGYSYPKDSRGLSPAAARLFAGVKQTKDGLEIKTRNVDKNVELLMRHAGMLADKDKDKGGSADEKAAAVRALVAALDATEGSSSNGAT